MVAPPATMRWREVLSQHYRTALVPTQLVNMFSWWAFAGLGTQMMLLRWMTHGPVETNLPKPMLLVTLATLPACFAAAAYVYYRTSYLQALPPPQFKIFFLSSLHQALSPPFIFRRNSCLRQGCRHSIISNYRCRHQPQSLMHHVCYCMHSRPSLGFIP